MGLNINLNQLKPDYSALFGGLSSGSSGGGMLGINLSDYASIKNGSYGKLMSAYYGGKNSTVNEMVDSSISTSKDSAKELTEIQGAADDLKESADKLMETGRESLFATKDVTATDENGKTTTVKEYDTGAIYDAMSEFVDNYNTMLKQGLGSNTDAIADKSNSLKTMTKLNEKMLGKIGISVGESGRLSLDEEEFKKSDMATVKSLFNGTGSYAYRVSAQASLIDFAAVNEVGKSNTYNANGAFSNNYSEGSIFGSYI